MQTQQRMEQRVHLTTWIGRSTRARFALVARAQGLSESALLRRLVESTVPDVTGNDAPILSQPDPVTSSGRISVRLRIDDSMLLRERAAARRLPTSTYISYLVRGHLRSLTPLPTAELDALKRSVAEVGAIGRNINQIARAVNQEQWPGGPSKSDLLLIIKALTAMRDHIKSLITANLASWSTGNAPKDR
jgi:hypothetical protein